MEIAKGIQNTQYLKLDLSDYSSPNWDIAIGFLDQRLKDRYIEPIEVLQAAEQNKSLAEKKYGFTILAIDCFLVETIQSFYDGETDSEHKSRRLFTKFLMERDNFQKHFKTQDEADDFYHKFRCGIVHQTQTFGNTKVWAVGGLIFHIGNSLIVNREEFHKVVTKEKDIYLSLVMNRKDKVLMDNFKKKMDFIAST